MLRNPDRIPWNELVAMYAEAETDQTFKEWLDNLRSEYDLAREDLAASEQNWQYV